MKKTAACKASGVCLAATVLVAAAMPATAQLEIGGQPFESTAPTPAAATNETADSVPGAANDVTRRIQLDLVALGYEPGSINGEMSVETAIAISKFQAENGLEVSGEASPQLAGILAARVSAMRGGTVAQTGAAEAAKDDAGCVRDAAAETSSTSRNAGRLARAGGRLLSRLGADSARDEISDAAQAASDVAEAADAVVDLTNCE